MKQDSWRHPHRLLQLGKILLCDHSSWKDQELNCGREKNSVVITCIKYKVL